MINKRKNDLLQQIAQLEQENQKLRCDIHRIDDKELFEKVNMLTEMYRKIFYRKLPIRFMLTVFYTHRNILLKYANGCFIEKILDAACPFFHIYPDDELIMHIPMYCRDVLIKFNCISFILEDPYRTITTKPLTKISKAEALSYKGRMIIAKLKIPEDHRAVQDFELVEFMPLKMNLTNYLGEVAPKDYNTLFTRFKDVTTESESVNAIDFIETYYRKHNQFIVVRCNKYILRIVTDEKKIAIWYDSDQLWYADESITIYEYRFALEDAKHERDSILFSGEPYNFSFEYLFE